jgi:sodium pump decarboxylase gamma subunit
MKKKFLILSLFAALVFALTGCSKELPEDFESDYYVQQSQAYVLSVLKMTEDEEFLTICANDIGFVFSEDDVSIDLDLLQDMCAGTITAMDEAGTPGEAVKEVSYQIENDTVTIICTVPFETHDVNYEFTYSTNEKAEYNSYVMPYELTQIVVSTQYSMGELLQKAGMNTLMGMGIVFIVLIFISLIISLFKYLPGSGARQQKAKEAAKKAAADAATASKAPAAKPAAPVTSENLMDNKELVAVITAAIYAANAEGPAIVSSDRLVVRSIKRASR